MAAFTNKYREYLSRTKTYDITLDDHVAILQFLTAIEGTVPDYAAARRADL